MRLRDNRFGENALAFAPDGTGGFSSSDPKGEGLGGQAVPEEVRALLETFGGEGCSLQELANRAGEALVVLSGSHLEKGNDAGKAWFFRYEEGKDTGGFSLKTGNLMGVLRFRDTETRASVQVEVLSRFDKGADNHFLNYLLSRVFDFAQGAEAVSARPSSLLELLLDVVFVRRLGEAAAAGLLRHYREFRTNDWAFKGSLDLPRHVRENVPFPRGIACRKREIDLDVPVNRMILAAALAVKRRHPGLFETAPDAADALRQLRTGVAEPHDVRAVLAHRECREPVRHPFFRDIWEPLRKIARMILEEERWTLFADADEEEEVSGVVFDGSWLWEEYLATVLGRDGFVHGRRGDGNGLKVFEDGTARFVPDFRLPAKGGSDNAAEIVLDAKYKRSNPNGGRDDVHQVLCYLLLTGAKLGGLVFPPADAAAEKPTDPTDSAEQAETYGTGTGWSAPREIASPYSPPHSTDGEKIRWRCFSFAPPPIGATWESFCDHMEKQEEVLRTLSKEEIAP